MTQRAMGAGTWHTEQRGMDFWGRAEQSMQAGEETPLSNTAYQWYAKSGWENSHQAGWHRRSLSLLSLHENAGARAFLCNRKFHWISYYIKNAPLWMRPDAYGIWLPAAVCIWRAKSISPSWVRDIGSWRGLVLFVQKVPDCGCAKQGAIWLSYNKKPFGQNARASGKWFY